jgi:hypothetical protein
MFHDLDASLRALLGDPAAPTDLRGADVGFDTPDRDYRPAQATLNLFLHEVAENRQLRDDARVVAPTASGYTSRLPSLRVDCTYLATAWSSRSAGLKAQEEHRLLGLALLWLSRFPVIDERYLQGTLKTPAQPYPVPTVVAQTAEGQAMGHFWSALGISPRPAFSLTVTIAVDPFDDVEQFPEVRAVQVQGTTLDDPVLMGRVLDHQLAPVPDATVTLIDQGGQAVGTRTSDQRGAFPEAEFATYTLQVRAAAHPDHEKPVIYARDRQVHNVVLPGPDTGPNS